MIQIAEPDASKCAALWQSARNLYEAVALYNGPILPYVTERWTARNIEYQEPTEEAPHAELVHFTSGTTGERKMVQRTWESLERQVRRAPFLMGERFACGYPTDTMAGIQVVLTCQANGAMPGTG